MAEIPQRIQEIVVQLKEGKQPYRQSPRKILRWFNASRRGEKIAADITNAFRLVGLRTLPDFSQAEIDEPLTFALAESETAGDPPNGVPDPNQATSPQTADQSHTTGNYDGDLDQLEEESEEDEEPPPRADRRRGHGPQSVRLDDFHPR